MDSVAEVVQRYIVEFLQKYRDSDSLEQDQDADPHYVEIAKEMVLFWSETFAAFGLWWWLTRYSRRFGGCGRSFFGTCFFFHRTVATRQAPMES